MLESRSDSIASITTTWLAPIALCLALLGIASASILIVIAEQEIGPNAITCNRLGLAAIAFALGNGVQLIRDSTAERTEAVPPHYTPSDVGLLLLSGISFAVALTLWAWSLSQTSVANSTLLNNMLPIFTTLGAWLVLGRQFSGKFLLGMGMAIVGAIAIGLQDLQVSSGLMGDAAALFAAILSAINILSVEQLRIQYSAASIMLWQSLIGSLLVLVIALLTEDVLFPTSSIGWTAVLGLALLAQVMGQGLLTFSLKNFPASLVAVSMLSIPVIAAFLALFIFSEHLSLMNWLAFTIVLAGIYISISAPKVIVDPDITLSAKILR